MEFFGEKLKVIHQNHPALIDLAKLYDVTVAIDVVGEDLLVRFGVDKKDTPCHVSADFKSIPLLHKDGNWGLWEFDVMEIFMRPSHFPEGEYIERQASPTGQLFALNVIKPRAVTYCPLQGDFSFQSEFYGPSTWMGSFRFTLRELGDLKKLKLNLFAVLTFPQIKGNERVYFALNHSLEERPDFHRPELFVPLEVIKRYPNQTSS